MYNTDFSSCNYISQINYLKKDFIIVIFLSKMIYIQHYSSPEMLQTLPTCYFGPIEL